MKPVKIIAAAAAAIVILLALVIVIGLPSNLVNGIIQSRIERASGYQVEVTGPTRLSLWPSPAVTLNGVSLRDPKDATGIGRLAVDSLRAELPLASVWSTRPQLKQLILTRPVIQLPLSRQRAAPSSSARQLVGINSPGIGIEHVRIQDGTLAFASAPGRIESRLEAVEADLTVDARRNLRLAGGARAGGGPLTFEIKAALPARPVEKQAIPVDFAVLMPESLPARLEGKAELKLNGQVVMINSLSGALGNAPFNGWASVDIASKPLVKLDLDFQRLEIASANSSAGSASQAWSTAPIDVNALNYVDARLRLSATEARIGTARFAPAAVDASLADGVLKANVTRLGAYGGEASGELLLDATSGQPSFYSHADLLGVRALPVLEGLAGFDKLDGKLQAKIAVRSAGASQRALMSNMQGTVFADFRDGAIRGINVAQMIRSLTTNTLSGWQESNELSTDLTQLSASFRIDKGQATTTDLNLVGPLVRVTGVGTVDLGTKLMGFRVEPKLVMTTEGQGRTNEPIGFGIPVMIEGSWSEPRIYPDMAGILDNPDAGYARLKEMGKGLFGPNGAGLDSLLGGLLGGGSAKPGSGAHPAQPGGAPAPSAGFGTLGETIGNLVQGLSGTGHNRSIPNASSEPQARPSPGPADPGEPQPDSEAMNEVLRQLFRR